MNFFSSRTIYVRDGMVDQYTPYIFLMLMRFQHGSRGQFVLGSAIWACRCTAMRQIEKHARMR